MRSDSRKPAERESINEAVDAMEDLVERLSESGHAAHSTMDYEQALRVQESSLWLAGFSAQVVQIRVKQSGKSAARARRSLGEEAI